LLSRLLARLPGLLSGLARLLTRLPGLLARLARLLTGLSGLLSGPLSCLLTRMPGLLTRLLSLLSGLAGLLSRLRCSRRLLSGLTRLGRGAGLLSRLRRGLEGGGRRFHHPLRHRLDSLAQAVEVGYLPRIRDRLSRRRIRLVQEPLGHPVRLLGELPLRVGEAGEFLCPPGGPRRLGQPRLPLRQLPKVLGGISRQPSEDFPRRVGRALRLLEARRASPLPGRRRCGLAPHLGRPLERALGLGGLGEVGGGLLEGLLRPGRRAEVVPLYPFEGRAGEILVARGGEVGAGEPALVPRGQAELRLDGVEPVTHAVESVRSSGGRKPGRPLRLLGEGGDLGGEVALAGEPSGRGLSLPDGRPRPVPPARVGRVEAELADAPLELELAPPGALLLPSEEGVARGARGLVPDLVEPRPLL
jgi:hypothetical protein